MLNQADSNNDILCSSRVGWRLYQELLVKFRCLTEDHVVVGGPTIASNIKVVRGEALSETIIRLPALSKLLKKYETMYNKKTIR